MPKFMTWLARCALLGVGPLVVLGCEPFYHLLEKQRTPARYLIPAGFVGWIEIEYEVSGAPPVPTEAGYLLFRVPESGMLEVSASPEAGWAKDELYYVDAEGRRTALPETGVGAGGMIWGEVTDQEQTPGQSCTFLRFFVGPEFAVSEPESKCNA